MRFMDSGGLHWFDLALPLPRNRPVAVLMAAGISEPETSVVQLLLTLPTLEFGSGVWDTTTAPGESRAETRRYLANELNSQLKPMGIPVPSAGEPVRTRAMKTERLFSFCSFCKYPAGQGCWRIRFSTKLRDRARRSAPGWLTRCRLRANGTLTLRPPYQRIEGGD